MDDWLQDHMVKTHCSGHRVDAGSGTDTAHAAAGTSPCLPRCCQPQTLKRPLKKTSPEPSRFRGCMHAGKENVSERFAFEHICGPGLCSRPAGFTPPSEQPQVNFDCSDVAAESERLHVRPPVSERAGNNPPVFVRRSGWPQFPASPLMEDSAQGAVYVSSSSRNFASMASPGMSALFMASTHS